MIGFGVLWNRDRASTWSHTPLSLLHGLEATGPVADLGFDDALRRWAYLLAHLRIRDGRLTTTWQSSQRVMAAAAKSIQQQADVQAVDAIVTVGDLGTFDRPTYIVMDLSYDLLEREIEQGNEQAAAQFNRLSEQVRRENRQRQYSIFDEAAGLLTMSQWCATSLVEDTGLPESKVHVVHPGANAAPTSVRDVESRVPSALFVGRDFHRKGGELTLRAVERMRADGVELGLTIMGPDDWPLDEPCPTWVDFRGPQPLEAVGAAMADHTVFVLPTRFEAFGIVFAEALLAGTPAVGPARFAVPEIVRDGVDGATFDDWTVDEVADAIGRAIAPDVRRGAVAGVDAARERWTWTRAADEVRAIVSADLSSR